MSRHFQSLSRHQVQIQQYKTISRHRSFMSRQQQHEAVRNSVMKKENIIATKVEKNHRNNVATQ